MPAVAALLPVLIMHPDAIYGMWLMQDIGGTKARPGD